jgi:outer membrane scaffolding protein for murein synthesis (MipA/OmpV family)
MMRKQLLIFICITVIIAMQTSMAAQPRGFVGGGFGIVPEYEGANKYEAGPAFFGRYNFDNGMYIGTEPNQSSGRAFKLFANLIPTSMNEVLNLGPILQIRPGRDDVDTKEVDRMKDIDTAVELGGAIGLNFGDLDFFFTGVADVSDTHTGSLINLSSAYRWPFREDLSFTFSIAGTWASDDYMQTYFGVSGSDSQRSGLPRYKADAGFKDVDFGVRANYITPWSKNWGILGSLRYSRLLGDAKDSPLVDDVGDKNQWFFALAASYTFW